MSVFVQNDDKKEMKVFLFCVLTFEPIITKTCEAPQKGRQNLSFVEKLKHMQWKNWPEKIVRRSFIK